MALPGQDRAVPVWVGDGLLARAPDEVPRYATGALIADAAVAAAHADLLETFVTAVIAAPADPLLLPAGEETKDAARLHGHWTALAERGLDRGAVLVVAGGGSTLDLGAFLGATWLRGVSVVIVPSTLLAQVDAGLGGKCGVNLGGAKNQVGAIWQPDAIVADRGLLRTLPASEWASGLGEVVKTALLAGDDLLAAVQGLDASLGAADPSVPDIVAACLRYKSDVVSADEREGDQRAVLNLGHTVGHVLEGLALEAGIPVAHGVAVAVGLVAETTALAGDAAIVEMVRGFVRHVGLPDTLDVEWDDARVRMLLDADKKRRGATTRVPVLRTPGNATIEDVALDALVAACRLGVAS
ncbi:MAG: 3-dehydroquinate synthase [Planctomycetes bacterium]|nr:3-dehydroquinate synthase [Planctomycetota bacterium]